MSPNNPTDAARYVESLRAAQDSLARDSAMLDRITLGVVSFIGAVLTIALIAGVHL